MRYSGSKGGYVKGIIRVIRSLLPTNGTYWEPFVGAGKIIAAVRCKTRYGSDLDPHIIGLLKAVRDGWIPPPKITEEEYKEWQKYAKENPESQDPMIGFLGYGCSFGGKFFRGFVREDDVAEEQKRTLLKQAPKLKGCRFAIHDYQKPLIRAWGCLVKPTLIYCDPPYVGTIRVGNQRTVFDTDEFWKWAQEWSKVSIVLVSEYSCPIETATVVWERTKGKRLRSKDGSTKTERLYCLRSDVAPKIGLGIL